MSEETLAQRRRVPPALAEVYVIGGQLSMQWEPTPSGVFRAGEAAELCDKLVRAIGAKMLEQDQALMLQLRGALFNVKRVQALVEPNEIGQQAYDKIIHAREALERALTDLGAEEYQREASPPPVGSTAERAARGVDPLGIRNAEAT